MEDLAIKAVPRQPLGKRVKLLRKEGFIPAIIYGHGIDSSLISVRYNDFEKLYQKAGKSTIFNLEIPGRRSSNVLIQDIQIDPLTRRFAHIDFLAVKMTEKITTEVPLEFIGVSPAVEEKDGILVKNITSLEVSCLPADLPHSLEVDISSLSDFEDSIHINDLKVPPGIEIIGSPEEVVATVEPPRSEEELAALEEAPVPEVAEVVEVSEEKPEEMEEEKVEEKVEEGKIEEGKEKKEPPPSEK